MKKMKLRRAAGVALAAFLTGSLIGLSAGCGGNGPRDSRGAVGSLAAEPERQDTAQAKESETGEPERPSVSEESAPLSMGTAQVWEFNEDGYSICRVKDLLTDVPVWRMVTESAAPEMGENGKIKPVDYSKENRWFEEEDGSLRVKVRRWDNLLYSCGPYLVYEYDQTIYAAKPETLYQPVLSYDKNGTMNVITKVKDKLMIVNHNTNQALYYNTDFELVKAVEGIRASEDFSEFYAEGLMQFRDMDTGYMGYLDENGEVAIKPLYAAVSPRFHNGYASVLADAEQEVYYEEQGSVKMFFSKGGKWGIIDKTGNYVVEPSDTYKNAPAVGDETNYYPAPCYFTEVDEEGGCVFYEKAA